MNTLAAVIFSLVFLLLCGTSYAAAQGVRNSAVERKNYEKLAPPVGPYSHAVKYGNTLYLSGLTAYGTEAQAKVWRNRPALFFPNSKSLLRLRALI